MNSKYFFADNHIECVSIVVYDHALLTCVCPISGRIFPDRVLSGGHVARARLGRSCGSSPRVPATPPARRQAREQPLVTSKFDLS